MTAIVGYCLVVCGFGMGWIACALLTRRERDA